MRWLVDEMFLCTTGVGSEASNRCFGVGKGTVRQEMNGMSFFTNDVGTSEATEVVAFERVETGEGVGVGEGKQEQWHSWKGELEYEFVLCHSKSWSLGRKRVRDLYSPEDFTNDIIEGGAWAVEDAGGIEDVSCSG